jgi:hypothetical protein
MYLWGKFKNSIAMKKLITFLIFGMVYTGAFSNPIVIADTMRIEGKLVLWLMVDGYEAGWEYGRLLGEPIANVMENYVINHTFGGVASYQSARDIFDEHFIYDPKYEEIAQGMIDGMVANGVSIFSPTLGEDLTFKDVLIANSIPDFTSYGDFNLKGPGCSDLMSWGEATINSELDGELVISRNLDWENNPYLINNALVIIWGNMGGNGQRFITLGFTGLIGALSGFNESGIVTFQNMGNHNMAPTGTGFYPVNLAQRNGLESWDYNNDGICSPRDVTDAVRANNVSSTFIINTAGPNTGEYPAEILEIHNKIGEDIRTVENNFYELGENLASTNHFRKLMPPVYCSRYKRFVDSLEASGQLDIHRNWRVLQAAGVYSNLQTIQFIPYMRLLRFSFAETGTPAYLIEPTEIWVDTLFSIVGINEHGNLPGNYVTIAPNPCSNQTNIRVSAPDEGTLSCRIFDLTGKLIFSDETFVHKDRSVEFHWENITVFPGVYFCQIELRNKNNLKMLLETSKIVVAR